jgi:hypothetical protein
MLANCRHFGRCLCLEEEVHRFLYIILKSLLCCVLCRNLKRGMPKAAPADHMAAQRRSLLQLPEEILSEIARRSSAKIKGHSMLGVSTGLRDAVLSSLSTLHLDLADIGDNFQPLARLLGRACSSAAPGLDVHLDMDKVCHEALPVLLAPALDAQGWHNVHRLEVRADQAE